jgi:hypothetical protein
MYTTKALCENNKQKKDFFSVKFYKKNLENIKLRDPKTIDYIKKYMADKVLTKIAQNEFLSKNLVLIGGTSLYIVYRSPRRTTRDLDFNCILDPTKENLEALKENLLLLSFNVSKEQIPLIKKGSKINAEEKKFNEQQFAIAFRYKIQEGLEPVMRIEGRFNKVLYEPVEHKIDLFSSIKAEQPKEILLDKIVAIYQRFKERGSIKPADFFDINYIIKNFNIKIKIEELIKKMELQKIKIDIDDIIKVFEIVLNEKIDGEKIKNNIKNQIEKNYFLNIDFQQIVKENKKLFRNIIKNLQNSLEQ